MKSESPKGKQIKKDKAYWEARQNLFGFFSLLLEVDKRVNPNLYKKQEIKNNPIEKQIPRYCILTRIILIVLYLLINGGLR